MKNGQCPKCGAAEVYHSDAKGFETGFGGGDWAGVHLRISKG